MSKCKHTKKRIICHDVYSGGNVEKCDNCGTTWEPDQYGWGTVEHLTKRYKKSLKKAEENG